MSCLPEIVGVWSRIVDWLLASVKAYSILLEDFSFQSHEHQNNATACWLNNSILQIPPPSPGNPSCSLDVPLTSNVMTFLQL